MVASTKGNRFGMAMICDKIEYAEVRNSSTEIPGNTRKLLDNVGKILFAPTSTNPGMSNLIPSSADENSVEELKKTVEIEYVSSPCSATAIAE